MIKITIITRIGCLLAFGYSQSQVDFSKFKGQEGKFSFTREYSYSNLYNYKINAFKEDSIVVKSFGKNIPEEILVKTYGNDLALNTKDSLQSYIILYSKLSIEVQNNMHAFIKYKLFKDGNPSDFKVIDVFNDGLTWRENTTTNKEINILKNIMLMASVNMIFKFYNNRDNPKYPEINRLKPQVKDGAGVLNIEKLAQVLNENKSQLQKYLDE